MDINGMKYRVQKAVAKEDNIQTELLLIFLLETSYEKSSIN